MSAKVIVDNTFIGRFFKAILPGVAGCPQECLFSGAYLSEPTIRETETECKVQKNSAEYDTICKSNSHSTLLNSIHPRLFIWKPLACFFALFTEDFA